FSYQITGTYDDPQSFIPCPAARSHLTDKVDFVLAPAANSGILNLENLVNASTTFTPPDPSPADVKVRIDVTPEFFTATNSTAVRTQDGMMTIELSGTVRPGWCTLISKDGTEMPYPAGGEHAANGAGFSFKDSDLINGSLVIVGEDMWSWAIRKVQ